MSELSDLKETVKSGLDRIHSRLDKAFDEQKELEIKVSGHTGDREIHTRPPCAAIRDHIDNHKDSKASWLAGIGLIIAALTYLGGHLKGFFTGH